MIGKRYKIVHLQSERGQLLNGKCCRVLNYDHNRRSHTNVDYDYVPRLHCQLETDDVNETTMVKLKLSNLVSLDDGGGRGEALETFMDGSSPIPDNVLEKCLDKTLRTNEAEGGGGDRQDLQHRLQLYRDLLQKIQSGQASSLTDQDYCFPCGAGCELLGRSNLGRVMLLTKPACCGNEVMDIRYMDIGLKGDNNTECSICQEVLAETEEDPNKAILVTLPCLHIFHKGCIGSWLQSSAGFAQWNCPTCRTVVPGQVWMYCVDYEEQLQRRIDEYPISGYCTKCMIKFMENSREKDLPIRSSDGTPITTDQAMGRGTRSNVVL